MTRAASDIDAVSMPRNQGRIGLVSCPGGRARSASGPTLDESLASIVAWGAEGLVTLIEDWEFAALEVDDLAERASAAGLWWRHLPIRDMHAPDGRFAASWPEEGAFLHSRLEAGARIVLHCWAGLGRTGTIAAQLLIEAGTGPGDAIDAVRQARPGSIQSREQEDYLLALTPG